MASRGDGVWALEGLGAAKVRMGLIDGWGTRVRAC